MQNDALIVDLYELTMAAGYFELQYNPKVTFELFIRDLPEHRNFLVSAGLEQAIDYLQNIKFTQGQIDYLKTISNFKNISDKFFDYLKNFRFTGNLYAVPEGTIIFPNEPILQIEAPLIEAQIVETFLLSTINFQTMVASKAARVVLAANSDGLNRGVMEFGSRRAHSPNASVFAARAAYLAGFIGSSNVEAGHRFQIPVFGTTAHSWTMAFNSEVEAFQSYRRIFGEEATFLIDTYDTEQGVKNAMQVAKNFKAVRIDSGDLEAEAKKIRHILDKEEYNQVKIILSSDLNEYKIENLINANTPVDSFGVGTQVATSSDAPSLQGVYKMVEIKETGGLKYRAKFSRDKITLPARKQIWRFKDEQGIICRDLLALPDENFLDVAKPLIKNFIMNGKLQEDLPSIENTREIVRQKLKELPEALLNIKQKESYEVETSPRLQKLAKQLQNKVLETLS